MKTIIAFLATLVFVLNLGPQVAMAGSSNDQKTPALAIDCSEGQADLDENGAVGFNDLSLLLGNWGQGDYDLTGDGIVSFSDLESLLSCWGDVPPEVDEPTNQAPVVDLGPDRTHPVNFVLSLPATVTDDGLPLDSELSYEWTQLNGPQSATFENANSQTASIMFSQQGVYTFQLVVSDGSLEGSDDIVISVEELLAIPVLSPGNGFSGPPEPLAAFGSGNSRTAKPIGLLNIVPWQTIDDSLESDGKFYVGVVAFHMNGMDRVEFSANGGPWTAVYQRSRNPRTSTAEQDLYEFLVALDPNDFPGGEIELRAKGFPKTAGTPRYFAHDHEITRGPEIKTYKLFTAVNRETRYVNPGQSIKAAALDIQNAQGGSAGGGLIYLNDGNHGSPDLRGVSMHDRMLRIAGAPGTSKENVIIRGYIGTGKVEFSDLTFEGGEAISSGSQNQYEQTAIWFHRIIRQGGPLLDNSDALDFRNGVYATESVFYHGDAVGEATPRYFLQRNLIVDRIRRDALRDPRFVINVQFPNANQTLCGGGHVDLIQYYVAGVPEMSDGAGGPVDNTLFYNIEYRSACGGTQWIQLPSGDIKDMDNMAMINVLFYRPESAANSSGNFHPRSNHFLMINNTFVSVPLKLSGKPLGHFQNWVVEGNVSEFLKIINYFPEHFSIQNNHMQRCNGGQLSCTANGNTVGDPGYTNWYEIPTHVNPGNPMNNLAVNPAIIETFDFHPAPNSILNGRISNPFSIDDAYGDLRSEPTACGALIGASE